MMNDADVIAIAVHPDTLRAMPVGQRAALVGLGIRVIESARVPVGSMVKLTRAAFASPAWRSPPMVAGESDGK